MSAITKYGPQEPVRSTAVYDCGICCCYHPWDWDGDCRDNNNRYGSPEEYAERYGINLDNLEVFSMDERVEADQ